MEVRGVEEEADGQGWRGSEGWDPYASAQVEGKLGNPEEGDEKVVQQSPR